MARKSRKTGAEQAAPETSEVTYNTALYVRLSVLDSGKKDGESMPSTINPLNHSAIESNSPNIASLLSFS
ncbi:hypothetical protein FACS189425_02090 [Clostridia bacterium]|nr:hypothetical protein FACS189425_02090 [Clostridia bacterium]